MNEISDIKNFVRDWPPFDRIGEADLSAVCSSIEVSYQPKDTELLAFGAPNSELHLVRKGAVGLFDETKQLVDKRDEGGLYGYPSLLTGQSTRMAVRALEDTLVYHIPGEIVRNLRLEHPRFDQFFSAKLVDRVTSGLQQRSGRNVTVSEVRTVMSAPIVSMDIATSIGDAAAFMANKRVSALAITDEKDLKGILTDRDFRNRVIVQQRSYDTSVAEVMTPDPWTCDVIDNVLQAQVTMLEKSVHHLPVLDNGQLVGMLTLSDVLRAHNNEPVYFIRDVRRSVDEKVLASIAKKRFALFQSLVNSGINSVHVLRVMTAITDATTLRLIELAEAQFGLPPMKYDWICLGSQARREQSGRTDQDNGLVLEREPNPEERAYFAKLATFVCTGLDDAGFVFCPGNIMAMNPQWCMSVDSWEKRFHRWMSEPEPKALMFASIFFDQRCVAGSAKLVHQLRKKVFEQAKNNSIFLAHMATNALEQRPPVSFFRQFILEQDGEHNEGLNLKHRGVVPIVALARLKALELGIEDAETAIRLKKACGKNTNREDMADLLDAMNLIAQIRNETQAAQITAGEEPTNLVPPKSLSPLSRRHLKAAFSVVRRAQQNLSRYHSME